MKCIGIDGCKKGWFYVSLTEASWNVGIFETISGLSEAMNETDIAVIDIPIGLKNSGQTERSCERLSRKVLGPGRGSSVFVVPVEQAVYCQTYEDSSKTNHEISGRFLSQQTWGIVPKIREVDTYMREPGFNLGLLESHPEVAFWSLNGSQPLQFNKKCVEGIHERIAILERHEKWTQAIFETAKSRFLRKEVALDDILDALCLAVIARYRSTGQVKSLPPEKEVNHRGIEMKIHYYG